MIQGKRSNSRKKVIIGVIILMVVAGGATWYMFTEKFGDTAQEKPAYTVNALSLIREFREGDKVANKKYAEKIITVTGTVTGIEKADTTINIKMGDTSNGSYTIFAFQQQHLGETKNIREGDKISIKGSCSGGVYSEILETEFISFKRCTLINK